MKRTTLGAARSDGPGWYPWLIAAGTGAVLIWWLLSRRVVKTQTAPLPPIEPPSEYRSLGAVSTRFDQVRELYRMGMFTPVQALNELDSLANAAVTLAEQGNADPTATDELMTRLERFREDVLEFMGEVA